ncbi:MAG: hypothetical protein M1817_002416 [Caeruleum heppii]|nr:MAG: hypothetical protein M1817_002416 [Caeruleum heppii]
MRTSPPIAKRDRRAKVKMVIPAVEDDFDALPPAVRRKSANVQADAQWFLSLPDKIRKKQFTLEEQALFGRSCDHVILDAADEAIYKSDRPRTASPMTSGESASTPPSLEDGDEPRERDLSNMDQSTDDAFRWVEEDDELEPQLTFDDYHSHIAGESALAALSMIRHSKRPHTDRPLTSYAFGGEFYLPTKDLSLATGTPSDRLLQVSRKSSPIVGRTPKTTPAVGTSEATHYQDPTARMKLRVYLASPQKFDEAVEFGFPSMENVSKDAAPQQEPDLEADEVGLHKPQTFFDDDDEISLSEDVDQASATDTDLPPTPTDVETPFRSPHRLPCLKPGTAEYADTAKLFLRYGHGDSYAQASAGQREMTLRMTLTRPDLRADEKALYGWQEKGQDDPLALEELPPLTEDVSGHGPFGGADGWGPAPKDQGLVKKLLKMIKPHPKKSCTS